MSADPLFQPGEQCDEGQIRIAELEQAHLFQGQLGSYHAPGGEDARRGHARQ